MAGQGTPASGANCAGRMRVCGGGDSGSCAEWGLLLSGEARLSLGITLVSNTFARIALQLALMDYNCKAIRANLCIPVAYVYVVVPHAHAYTCTF